MTYSIALVELMRKNLHFKVGDEVVFGSSDSAISQAIRRAVKAKQLRKLVSRVYTSSLNDAPENIIRRNLYLILGGLFPGAILSHRTALEGGPSPEGLIILSYLYDKKIQWPGITIRLIKAMPAQINDTAFMGKLYIASRARALLENCESTRGHNMKSLSRGALETYLDKICRIHGVKELNKLRDEAHHLAPQLHLESEYHELDQLIGAILNTQPTDRLISPNAIARSQGKAYDAPRIELFAKLVAQLAHVILPKVFEKIDDVTTLHNLAFFESYFSNYIEGTEFDVFEAADIIFHNKIIPNRSQDSHDILSTYQLASNLYEMKKIPQTKEELIQILQTRHHFVMSARKDKNPGEFKQIANRVGNTLFVQPELVRGTLERAFSLYESIEHGIKRAIFMMFLITEIHPFDDGNGRIARLMMNAELVSENEGRIIIPTVYREDYLLALRRLSRTADPEAYIKMLTRAQAFTASIDYTSYHQALLQLQNANAFMQSFEAQLKF